MKYTTIHESQIALKYFSQLDFSGSTFYASPLSIQGTRW